MKAFLRSVGILAVFLAALFVTAASNANTYYVTANGSDSNACTSIPFACATPNGAIALARAGDVVTILPGKVYGGGSGSTPPINLTYSGTGPSGIAGTPCSSPITVEGYPFSRDRPLIAGVQGATGGGGVFGNNVSCIIIQHLEFAGWNGAINWKNASINVAASGTGWEGALYDDNGIRFAGTLGAPAHDIWISDVSVHDFPGGGIGTVFADYITIENSVIYNNAQYSGYQGSCISLYILQNSDSTQTAHNLISGNMVAGCLNQVPNRGLGTNLISTTTGSGDTPSGSTSMTLASSAGFTYGMGLIDPTNGCIPPNSVVQTVTGNVITMGLPTTCDIPGTSSIKTGYMTDGEGVIIDDSNCEQQVGCTTPYTARTQITNNYIANNGGPGIQCAPNSISCDVYFNTLYFNSNAPYRWYVNNSGNEPNQINFVGSIGSNAFNNIIVAGTNVPTLANSCLSNCTFGNNLISGGVSGNYGQTVPGAGNVFADPMLLTPSFGILADFHLKSGSPALGAASTAYARATDYYGATDTAANDAIGAATIPICGQVASPLVYCSGSGSGGTRLKTYSSGGTLR